MKTINLEFNTMTQSGSCYVIAEIGHNHQGKLEKALEMIKVAAEYCNVQAVKFQKRNNKSLFTKKFYNHEYKSSNSYGRTYGEHREALEFGKEEYIKLMECAKAYNVDFIVTPFDTESVDFLEEIGVSCYKIASADVTNTVLIEYIARLHKPIILSTGACTLDEIRLAYEIINQYHDKLCILHCVASYPTEDKDTNLGFIKTLKKEFPNTIIGYSSHDLGILAPIVANALGATVIEKHFTLDKNLKGSDHKLSLEPDEMKQLVENLKAATLMYGSGDKVLNEYELDARVKMGKSIYSAKPLEAGTILTLDDITIKSPGGFLPPYEIKNILGKRLKYSLKEEEPITFEMLEVVKYDAEKVAN